MAKLLLPLLILFNQAEKVEQPSLDQVCETIVICECVPSKGGETCTMRVVTECES